MSAWDTDLGRWALAWRDYRRTTNAAPISSCAPEAAPDAGMANEVCDDERDADAAVGVIPAPLLVYAEPGGEV